MFGSNYVKKIFGTKNDREVKRLRPVVEHINGLEPEFEKLTDAELREKTDEFRRRLADGEGLDDLLPEAFAATREASRRTIGLRHFDAQLIGGMVLHEGKIAEMKTGEGKTLVATLAFYLNALTGKGVHLITVNDYLARRDVQWMGPIYHALGLSVSSIVHDASYRFDPTYITKDYRYLNLRPVSRQEAYRADITYGTNNEFGFDYLRDNMKFALEEYVQRELNFAVVDEVDNILIDEARTPLIISGPAEESTDKYYTLNRIIPKLQRGAVTQGDPSQEDREAILAQGDYTIDEKAKTVALTDGGVAKVERLLGVHNLYDPRHIDTLHHVNQGLKAHNIFRRDVDYVIKDGEIIIVDEFTGRLMPGRRWSDGLHQAVEAKEGVHIREENQTLATITIQNYFRMYAKLAGMTGTADTEAPEFKKIYDLDVLVVPTHRPMVRMDHADVVYRTEKEKYEAVVEEIAESHAKGQPVLVGTVSVEKSELLSSMLKKRKVKHNVLNAVNHEAEASIIAQAGRFGAVTIATNMAGRGTDILLGGNPEFLARSDMENEWITRAAKLPLQGQQRYEDALRELKERYDEQMRHVTERYKAESEVHENQRGDALRSFTEIQNRLMALSPFRDLREEYERVSSSQLIDALHSYRNIPESYVEMKESLDEAVLAHSGVDESARREFSEASKAFGSFVERWQSADGQRPQLLEAVDDSRRMYEQRLEEYEFVVTRSVVSQGEEAALVREFEANRTAFEEAEAHCEALRIPYEKDSRAAHEAYESKRQEYVQAVEEVREELEKAPEAYSNRYDEILAGYQGNSSTEREKVVGAGGLQIIGTERHESRRIDNQLRGRAGRQGDPGASRFFLSLEDDLMRIFGADRMQGIMNRLGMEEGVPIEHGLVSRAIENAQKKVEAHNFDIRKHLLEYDDVMNKQREVVYGQRRDALAGDKLRDDVLEMATQLAEETAQRFVDKQAMASEWDVVGLAESLRGRFNVRLELTPEEMESLNADDIEEKVVDLVTESYADKEERLGPELMRQLERIIMLQTIDVLWKDHLLNMDHLKEGIGLRGYGQKNPLHEYQREGYELFQEMSDRIPEDVVGKLFTVEVDQERSATELEELETRQAPRQMMLSHGDGEGPERVSTVRRDGDKVGRNSPCPCGSGKKYKRCHGK
ncbi:MAG: preprotein translocase subunit SecA [Deltaproteobacteria bacterium]|nr:preprotein translocase subunit SecA [Deltaproteobacteria bacterium]